VVVPSTLAPSCSPSRATPYSHLSKRQTPTDTRRAVHWLDRLGLENRGQHHTNRQSPIFLHPPLQSSTDRPSHWSSEGVPTDRMPSHVPEFRPTCHCQRHLSYSSLYWLRHEQGPLLQGQKRSSSSGRHPRSGYSHMGQRQQQDVQLVWKDRPQYWRLLLPRVLLPLFTSQPWQYWLPPPSQLLQWVQGLQGLPLSSQLWMQSLRCHWRWHWRLKDINKGVMSQTASSYLIFSFLFHILFRTAFSITYLTYLWNILAFSRDFHKVPFPSMTFYHILQPSSSFHFSLYIYCL